MVRTPGRAAKRKRRAILAHLAAMRASLPPLRRLHRPSPRRHLHRPALRRPNPLRRPGPWRLRAGADRAGVRSLQRRLVRPGASYGGVPHSSSRFRPSRLPRFRCRLRAEGCRTASRGCTASAGRYATSAAPAVHGLFSSICWWGRWDSNPHCKAPKAFASCHWATAPRCHHPADRWTAGRAAERRTFTEARATLPDGAILQPMPAPDARSHRAKWGCARAPRAPIHHIGHPRRTGAQSRPSFLERLATCPVAFTLYSAISILPSASMTKVERITPTTSLPYSFFTPYAP